MDIKRLLVEKERAFKAHDRCGGSWFKGKYRRKSIITKEYIHQRWNNCNWITIRGWRGEELKLWLDRIISKRSRRTQLKRHMPWMNIWMESDGRAETSCLDNAIEGVPISLSCSEVGQVFSLVKPLKAAGPDKLQSMVLRTCHEQLRFVFQWTVPKEVIVHTHVTQHLENSRHFATT